jgi:hypothetical protein
MPASANSGGPSAALRSGGKGTAGRTRDELVGVSALESDICTVGQARAHLERHGYLNPGMEATAKVLALSLLQLSGISKVPRGVSEGMRAITLLLEEAQLERMVEEAAVQVMERLLEAASEVSKVGVGLGGVAAHSVAALEGLKEGTQGLRETVEGAVTDLVGRADVYLGQTQAQAQARAQTALSGGTAPGLGSQGMSYAGAARRPPVRHAEVLARTHGRERQVLLDQPMDGTRVGDGVTVLTEKELVAKANAAVRLMGDDVEGRPDSQDLFLGAHQLRRGGVLYLMVSVEAANWVKLPGVKAAFMAHYEGLFEVKERGTS